MLHMQMSWTQTACGLTPNITQAIIARAGYYLCFLNCNKFSRYWREKYTEGRKDKDNLTKKPHTTNSIGVYYSLYIFLSLLKIQLNSFIH